MTISVVLRDQRLLARIINLAPRFGCSLARIDARTNDDLTLATFKLEGDADALRRLDAKISQIAAQDAAFAPT